MENQEETENNNTFELSFSSEEPYDRWFGPEILSHAEGEIDLSRLQTIGTVLFNHDIDKVIGRIDSVAVENSRGTATITFDEDELSQTVKNKVESGSLRGVSVGYIVRKYEEVAEGETTEDGFEGPAYIARDWEPLEISIVSVPADPTVGVGRDMEAEVIGTPEPVADKDPEGNRKRALLAVAERQLQINKNRFGGGN